MGNKYYEDAELYSLFSVPSIWIAFEGSVTELFRSTNPESMYFNKIGNGACREMTSGRIFYRTRDDHFYNEETGLYFDMKSLRPTPFAEFEIVSKDEEYFAAAQKYFNYYLTFKEEDDKLRDKAELALLQRGVTFRGDEKNSQ